MEREMESLQRHFDDHFRSAFGDQWLSVVQPQSVIKELVRDNHEQRFYDSAEYTELVNQYSKEYSDIKNNYVKQLNTLRETYE
jgi:hypothetical protein